MSDTSNVAAEQRRMGRRQAPSNRSPQRPIRIPDDVWYDAVGRAKEEGVQIGHVVTALLDKYADGDLDV